jgi:secreted trypsin-like serine protease
MLLATGPGAAARSGPADADAHPYVGLAIFGSGGALSRTCSGTLLSPRVFLTAAQCTDDADVAVVLMESDAAFSLDGAHYGQPVTHPAFNNFEGFPNSSDLGVVLLEEPVDLPAYASLPGIGALDGLMPRPGQPNAQFTAIGFGLQAVVPFMREEYIRFRGTPTVLDMATTSDGFNIYLSSGRSRRPAAPCVSDAGGPAFIGSSSVIAAVGSAVSNATCAGAGYYSRVDTEYAQEFIRGFLQ